MENLTDSNDVEVGVEVDVEVDPLLQQNIGHKLPRPTRTSIHIRDYAVGT